MKVEVLARYFKFVRNNIVFIWLTVMFIATSLPGDKLPQPDILFFDKIEHLIAFAIFSFLLCDRYIVIKELGYNKHSILLVIIIFSLYGIIDELHQKFIPGRYSDLTDFLADFVGGLLGIFIYTRYYISSMRKRIVEQLKKFSQNSK